MRPEEGDAERSVRAFKGAAEARGIIHVGGDNFSARLRQRLAEAARSCNAGAGVLVLADMFGGTPCNAALAMLRPGEVEVVSGMNMPALIKAATLRQPAIGVAELDRLTMPIFLPARSLRLFSGLSFGMAM